MMTSIVYVYLLVDWKFGVKSDFENYFTLKMIRIYHKQLLQIYAAQNLLD